jgi:hypothetical protein
MTRVAGAVWRGEAWLAILAGLVALALTVRAGVGWPSAIAMTTAVAYALVVWKCPAGSRSLLLAGYVVVSAGYLASALVVEALRVPVRSEMLLSFDRAMFGETPAVWLSSFRSPWVGDFLSAGYLSYLIYLHVALISALLADDASRARWMHQVWGAFAVGLIGYFLVPASSPDRAFPELFSQPLAGGFIMHANEALNAAGSARYDAFPSLHVLVTLTLLHHDWHERRGRFRVMLIPSCVMLVSTLALRMHYAVDLLVSAALFALLCIFWRFHPFTANAR